MFEDLFGCPQVRHRLQAHPFAGFLSEYATYLHSQGYALSTLQKYVGIVEHFASWLHSQGLSLVAVNLDVVHAFLAKHLPKCRCPSPSTTCRCDVRRALKRMLRLLRDLGTSELTSTAALRFIDAALKPYCLHLRETCGLAEATCHGRVWFAREFLRTKFGQRAVRLEVLRPKDVMDFMAEYAQRCRPGSIQVAASSLRRFLRYLQFQGWCGPSLVAAVPRIPHWRLADIPKTMTDQQLQEFLSTFDGKTAVGQRNYAMASVRRYLVSESAK